MNPRIVNNLNDVINNNVSNDKVNSSSKQGLEIQERKIFIYKCKDFFKLSRATINEKENQRFLWSCEKYKETTCYVLEESRPQRNTFLNVKAVGSNVEFFINYNELLDTENHSFIIGFNELNNDSKMEEIYFITSMRNLMGSEEVSYEYNLTALNTLSLGSGSQLKLLFDVPNNMLKNIKAITIKNQNKKSHFLGFDSNVDCSVNNVFPVWNKIINIDNSSIDYRNLWENKKWLLDWEELDKIRVGDKINLNDIFIQGDKIFTPAINLLKKIITLNISYINNFTQTADVQVGQVGENPGQFWKSELEGKSREAVSALLNDRIDGELKLWKNGSFRDEIKGNFPFGEIRAFPEGLSYSEKMVRKFFAVLTMLGSQIISNRAFLNGRNEATLFLLPYFLTIDETKIVFNNDYNLTTISNIEELTIESNYFILDYPVFNESQIEEYNNTGEVSDYKYDIKTDSRTKKYGELNPFLEVGDKPFKLTKIKETKTTSKLAYNQYSISAYDVVLGWGNNPLVSFITDYDINNSVGGITLETTEGTRWIESELFKYNVLPISISYSASTFYDKSPNSYIGFNETNSKQIKSVSFNDILNNNNIGIGVINEGGSNPTAEKLVEIERINETIQVSNIYNLIIENPFLDRIKQLVSEVNNDENKEFLGTPKVNFYIEGFHDEEGYTDFSYYEFRLVITIDCVIGEFDRTILTKIAKKRNLTVSELEDKIEESQNPQLITNDLKNEGLYIELLEQDVKLNKPKEILEEENFITLPSGYQNTELNTTWIYYPLTNLTISQFLKQINTEELLENTENNITINIKDYNVVNLSKLFLYYLNFSNADISFLYGDNNLTYDFKIRLGDKTDSSTSLTTLIFKEEEED